MDFGQLAPAAQLQAPEPDILSAPAPIELSGDDVRAFEQAYLPPVGGTAEAAQIDRQQLPTPQELLRDVLQNAVQSGEQAKGFYREFVNADGAYAKLDPSERLAQTTALLGSVYEWGIQTELMAQMTNRTGKFIETLIKGQ